MGLHSSTACSVSRAASKILHLKFMEFVFSKKHKTKNQVRD